MQHQGVFIFNPDFIGDKKMWSYDPPEVVS